MRMLKASVVLVALAAGAIVGVNSGFDLVNAPDDWAVILGTIVVLWSVFVPLFLSVALYKKGWI